LLIKKMNNLSVNFNLSGILKSQNQFLAGDFTKPIGILKQTLTDMAQTRTYFLNIYNFIFYRYKNITIHTSIIKATFTTKYI